MAIGNDRLPDADAAFTAGYKAGLLAGLRWAMSTFASDRVFYSSITSDIAHVEAHGELPKEA